MALAKFAPKQLELDTETQADRDAAKALKDAEADRQILLRIELMAACRAAVHEMGGIEVAARKLDDTWGREDVGRGVSGSTFKSCLGDAERNYFRLEWIIEFAEQSETVRGLLRAIAEGKAAKPVDDQLQDIHAIIRKRYPVDAESIIRQSRLKGVRR